MALNGFGSAMKEKNPRPCRGYVREIIRTGADDKFNCGTGRAVMLGFDEPEERIAHVPEETP